MKRDNCVNLALTNTCPRERREFSHVTRGSNFQVCFMENFLLNRQPVYFIRQLETLTIRLGESMGECLENLWST